MSVSAGVDSVAPYVEVSCKDGARGSRRRRPLLDCATARFEDAVPVRPFRWSWGGRHFSGVYWAATVRDHVIYESRLELTRLLFADFDPSVRGVVAPGRSC